MKVTDVTVETISRVNISHKYDADLTATEHFKDDVMESISITCSRKGFKPIFIENRDKSKGYDDLYEDYKTIEKLSDMAYKDLYYLNWSTGKLFDSNFQLVSLPFSFSYIGSLREKRPGDEIYAKLITALSAHPYVTFIESDVIPYYNSHFIGQMGISKMTVLLPDHVSYKLYTSLKGDENWSSTMNSVVMMGDYKRDELNMYGNEITELLRQHSEQAEESESGVTI